MAAAHRHGLRTAALTDHDTTSGWAEAAEAAASLGMTFMPGMELSARHEWRSVHVLAYLVDPDDPGAAGDDREDPLVTPRSRAAHGRPDLARLRPRLGRHRRADLGRRHRRAPAHRRRAGRAGARPRSRRGVLEHPQPARGLLRRAVRARSGHRRASSSPARAASPIIAHPAGRAGLLPMPLLERMLAAGLAGFELGHRENLEPGIRTLRRMTRGTRPHRHRIERLPRARQAQPARREHHDDEMVARLIDRATGTSPVYP